MNTILCPKCALSIVTDNFGQCICRCGYFSWFEMPTPVYCTSCCNTGEVWVFSDNDGDKTSPCSKCVVKSGK